MIDALRALGVGIEAEPGQSEYGDDLLDHPRGAVRGRRTVDCGQAGTVMRFVAPLAGSPAATCT